MRVFDIFVMDSATCMTVSRTIVQPDENMHAPIDEIIDDLKESIGIIAADPTLEFAYHSCVMERTKKSGFAENCTVAGKYFAPYLNAAAQANKRA